MNLEQDIKFLKGVGEKRKLLYQKLNIATIKDLLYHLPRSYLNLHTEYTINTLPPEELVAVKARIISKGKEQYIRKGLTSTKVVATDDTGILNLTFFNSKFIIDALRCEEEYLFYGKFSGGSYRKSATSPAIFTLQDATSFLPIYPLTSGLSSKTISNHLAQVIAHHPPISDFLSSTIKEDLDLVSLDFALRNIHFPKDTATLEACRKRLIFDEFYLLCLVMGSLKSKQSTKITTPLPPVNLQSFYASLPFSPTNAQQKVLLECSNDLSKTTPMNRLVQGDVGSGKTLIAAGCIYQAAQAQVQSAMMVPTEILATQHYKTLSKMLEPYAIRIGLLTGSMRMSEKNKVKKQLQSGELDFCVGTHALISQDVFFENLGLIITDEQHRFGVLQRTAFSQKATAPHVLVMSATPIPRTLALIVYCDLDLSIIDELPPNRQPIETYKITSAKQNRAFTFIKKHLDKKLQAYIVCPLVETGELDMGLKPATQLATQLASNEFAQYHVGLLHGKMKPSEKEAMMQSFEMGKIDVLVSTTVIEVGVDVPNATIIFIQNAERFGLSQLHQLRGRVGRGSEKSYCILLSDSKNQQTLERLSMLCSSNNGFEIAEYDLKTRGAGDFLGYRQHGLPCMKIADLTNDITILNQASTLAKQTLLTDPLLENCEHEPLKKEVAYQLKLVGTNPN